MNYGTSWDLGLAISSPVIYRIITEHCCINSHWDRSGHISLSLDGLGQASAFTPSALYGLLEPVFIDLFQSVALLGELQEGRETESLQLRS